MSANFSFAPSTKGFTDEPQKSGLPRRVNHAVFFKAALYRREPTRLACLDPLVKVGQISRGGDLYDNHLFAGF